MSAPRVAETTGGLADHPLEVADMAQRRRTDPVPRFWSKVDLDGPGGCWLWTAGDNGEGYGRFWTGTGSMQAHRFAYELLVGPIPEGLQIDHLCRVRRCVNPAHLEPVTQRENILRGTSPQAKNATKTHCPKGHPYNEENTRWHRGSRYCRVCPRVVRPDCAPSGASPTTTDRPAVAADHTSAATAGEHEEER